MKKLTEADRAAIARRLAATHREAVIGVREAAVLNNSTVASIQQACSPKRIARGDVSLKLPTRVKNNGRRVGWLLGDVLDLIGQCATQTKEANATSTVGPQSASPKRMGRPRQG